MLVVVIIIITSIGEGGSIEATAIILDYESENWMENLSISLNRHIIICISLTFSGIQFPTVKKRGMGSYHKLL